MISNTGECEMQLFKYASLLVTTFLLSISSVSAQDLYRTIDVIPLSENCDWAVAPDSTGVVFSTTDGGVADYLVGITTDAGFSSAVVSVCNADSIMQQSGDSGLALALPVALRRNNEIAFAMEVKLDPFADPPPGGNRSSYSSGSWLDDEIMAMYVGIVFASTPLVGVGGGVCWAGGEPVEFGVDVPEGEQNKNDKLHPLIDALPVINSIGPGRQ